LRGHGSDRGDAAAEPPGRDGAAAGAAEGVAVGIGEGAARTWRIRVGPRVEGRQGSERESADSGGGKAEDPGAARTAGEIDDVRHAGVRGEVQLRGGSVIWDES